RALAKRADDRFSTADEMRDALRAAALQAAESTLATVVKTVVQDAGRPYGRMPAGDEPMPPGSADERALAERAPAHPVEPMARVVVREARGQARLVDGLALYTPDADGPDAFRPPQTESGR
ncbi:MAG: hypothetical protein M3N82_11830, partial [Pseudomonadota bacterium]|nr:hypothetical protein [Pseudomonadota bacterium]